MKSKPNPDKEEQRRFKQGANGTCAVVSPYMYLNSIY